MNKIFFYSKLLLMLILPTLSVAIDFWNNNSDHTFWDLVGKWFVFWSIGLRLLTAGLRQSINPVFTAREIFGIADIKSFQVVKELGFANICLGILGSASLFIPEWRTASAISGGLFLGIAGVNHLTRKPSNLNEVIPMVSNLFVFAVLAAYLSFHFLS